MALSLQRYSWSDFSSRLFGILKERSKKEKERPTVIAEENVDRLPENLIFEILTWLPVKDVLRYKCVCRSWYDTISSRDFVSKHLKNFCYNNSDSWDCCILAQYYVSIFELQLFELLVDETPSALAFEVLYSMPMYGSYVCGPCDGIYYLFNYDSSSRALWNPAINEIKILPPLITKPNLPTNITCAKNEVYGFGLDPVTGNYKVVIIKGYWNTTDEECDISYPLSVFVYSFGSDSWRLRGDLTREYDLENNKCYMFVNGSFYWLGSYSQGDESSEVMVCFDLAADVFQEIKVPNYAQPASKSLGICHNLVAFLTIHDIDKNFSVWTLTEGAWTKKFTIGPLYRVRNPVGHWKDDKFVLEREDGNLVLCEPATHQVRDLGFQRNICCEGVYLYMESLVSVKDVDLIRQHEDAGEYNEV